MRKPTLTLRQRCNCAVAFILGAVLLGGAANFGNAASASAANTNGFRFIALSPFAGSTEDTARQFSALPAGWQSFHGVPFRADSRVTVTGIESARAGEFFPTEVTGLKIGSNAKRIHLLHGTMFAEKDGVPVAKLVFHYANGSNESVRIGYGIHVRAWIAPRLEKRSELFDPNSQLAWSDTDERRGTASRIFQTAIENPRPGEVIESVDIVSLFSRAAPFIAAMSVEGPESKLPPSHSPVSRKIFRDLKEFGDAVYRGEITVSVTDGPSGAVPKGAVVSLGITDDKETYFFGETKTDAKGVCHMPYPPLHAAGLNVWVHAPDRAPAIISESKTNRTKFSGNYVVTLQPGITVGGVVKDAASKPIGGAQVVIHKISRFSPHHYGRVDYDIAVTGADGKWTSRSLPDDLSGISFQVSHPDYRPALYATAGYAPPPTNTSTTTTLSSSSSVTYQRMPDGTLVPTTRRVAARGGSVPLVTTNALLASEASMTLQPAMLLEGTLVDTQGKPIPGAEVIVQRGISDRKYVVTDAKGYFQTRVGEPGQAFAVMVVRDGFAPFFRNVSVSGTSAPQEFRLAPARVMTGRVQDRNARPVSGARVVADNWNGTSDVLKFQALTDERGTFVWTGAPTDGVTFYVSKTNFSNTRHSFSGTMDEVVIPITRPPGVYGKVIDAETKKPIGAFTVIPGRVYSQGEKQIHWDRSDSMRGSGGEYSLRMSSYYFQPEAHVLIEAPGYEPQVSRGFAGIDSYTNDFALKKGKGIAGVVQLPDGSPAVAATLVVVEKGEYAYVDPSGGVRGNGGSSELARTDVKGHFEFVPKLEPQKIFVSHEQGFAEAKAADVLKSGKIVLQKWGRVKGAMRIGDKGDSEGTVRLYNVASQEADAEDGRSSGLSFSVKGDPDSEGNFVFEKVPPGEHRVALEYRFKDDRYSGPALSHSLPIAVKPGEVTDVTLGGNGRRVTGRVKVIGGDQSDVDWKRDVHSLVLEFPEDAARAAGRGRAAQQRPLIFLDGFNGAAPEETMTPEAARARERASRLYVLLFDTNGTFRIENVPAGKYMLNLNVTDPDDEYYNRRQMGSLSHEVIVPDEKGAAVNAPFDIGTLGITIHPRLKIGKTVPSFDAKTGDGKMIKLSDFRGKPVLLQFWGLSVGYSTYDLQVLKEFQSNYGTAGKLAIIGCNLDADLPQAQQFAKSQGMIWTQTYLGAWNQTTIPGVFGINGNSACVLLDAQGRLISGQLRGTALRNALTSTMSGVASAEFE